MRKIKCYLKTLLQIRNMEQKDIARLANVREATISEMCRDINKTFPRDVLERVVNALELDDINELITIINENK